jgi:transcriptional regulator with XRE-family HTH domain
VGGLTIPHRIRALLALRGWTVAQLATTAGLPPATVATHLRGRTDLTGRASGRRLSSRPPVEVYAAALGVPVEVLTTPWVVLGVAVEGADVPGGG